MILAGAPSHTVEAAVSTAIRVAEAWDVDEAVLLVSRFPAATQAAREAGAELERLGVRVSVEHLSGELSRDVERIKELVQSIDLVAPTAGSVASAVASSYIAASYGKPIAHVYFPFGYWTGLRYPYVPRPLQPIATIGGGPKPRSEVPLSMRNRFAEPGEDLPTLRREVARYALMVNRRLGDPVVNARLGVDVHVEYVEERLGGVTRRCVRLVAYGEAIDGKCSEVEYRGRDMPMPTQRIVVGADASISRVRELVKHALKALLGAGAQDIGEEGRLEQLYAWAGFAALELDCSRQRIIIDTNLVYQGVHNRAPTMGSVISVPYCARVEIMNNLAEARTVIDRVLATAASLALEVLDRYCSTVPTQPYKCDPTLPIIDPNIMANSCVASRDRRAVDAWRRTALSRLADVVEPGLSNVPDSDKAYAVMQLYALLIHVAATWH